MEGATDVEQYEVEIVEDLMVGAAQDRPACKLRSGISLSIVAALGSSEVIALADGELVLGQYQAVMLYELDGPRRRKVSVQVCGE